MEETNHKNEEERKHGGNLMQQTENGKTQQETKAKIENERKDANFQLLNEHSGETSG